jgi:hypothetical protein
MSTGSCLLPLVPSLGFALEMEWLAWSGKVTSSIQISRYSLLCIVGHFEWCWKVIHEAAVVVPGTNQKGGSHSVGCSLELRLQGAMQDLKRREIQMQYLVRQLYTVKTFPCEWEMKTNLQGGKT